MASSLRVGTGSFLKPDWLLQPMHFFLLGLCSLHTEHPPSCPSVPSSLVKTAPRSVRSSRIFPRSFGSKCEALEFSASHTSHPVHSLLLVTALVTVYAPVPLVCDLLRGQGHLCVPSTHHQALAPSRLLVNIYRLNSSLHLELSPHAPYVHIQTIWPDPLSQRLKDTSLPSCNLI